MEDLTSPQGSDEGIKVDPSLSSLPEMGGNGASVTIEIDDLDCNRDPSLSSLPEKAGNGASFTIEIDDLDRNRATSIKQRLHIELGRPKESSTRLSSTRFSCSIYRVPHFLRQYNEKVYDPQVVSIGPFHYGKRKNQLREMEEHKWRYLQDIISRNGEGSLERYLAVLNKLEEKARKCYSEVIPLQSESFVEMMLLDACFIIEFFQERRHSRDPEDDGIFRLEDLGNAIVCDLLMLENQIPFFILHRLFDLINGSSESTLLDIDTSLFNGFFVNGLKHSPDIQIQHLLHLMLYSEIFFLAVEKRSGFDFSNFQMIPCASKLKEAGITFRKQSLLKTSCLLDIKFQKGVIEIPCMEFWDMSNLVFLNLVAFEQCYFPCKKYITAYITFINSLISTRKDVEILCREGIIENWVGSDGDGVFNNVVRELTVRQEDFYLSGICKEINQYCEGSWPKMRATLVHDYFRNRWAIISFFAALFLLLLTLTQTFFSSFPKFAYGG